jgi:hypothetical protein
MTLLGLADVACPLGVQKPFYEVNHNQVSTDFNPSLHTIKRVADFYRRATPCAGRT